MTEKNQSAIDGVDYDPKADRYRAQFRPDTIEPSTATIAAIASVRRCDPSDLEPLYKSIDTDSLNTIIKSATTDTRISFEVDGFDVTVEASGTVEIVPPEAEVC
jgi:hypothetical protein